MRPAALTVSAVETLLADALPGHDVDASVARAVVAETEETHSLSSPSLTRYGPAKTPS